MGGTYTTQWGDGHLTMGEGQYAIVGGTDSIQGEGDGHNTMGDRHYTMWGGTLHSGGRTLLNGGGTDTMTGGSRHSTGCRIESVHPSVRLLSVFSEKGGQCLRFFACMRVYS